MADYHYNVYVDHRGGGDRGFAFIAAEELRHGRVVTDHLDREYVVTEARLLDAPPDPETGLIFGTARARPAAEPV